MTSTRQAVGPLPAAVQSALSAIANDLRHVPRDALASRMDFFLFLRRQAARVDGVRAMKVLTTPRPAVRPASPRTLTPAERAEAVFGGLGRLPARPVRRSILSRKGRIIAVESRQLEMML